MAVGCNSGGIKTSSWNKHALVDLSPSASDRVLTLLIAVLQRCIGGACAWWPVVRPAAPGYMAADGLQEASVADRVTEMLSRNSITSIGTSGDGEYDDI